MFRPGYIDGPQAARLNEMLRALEQLARGGGGAPLSVRRDGGQPSFAVPADRAPILAEITGDDGGTPPVYTAKRMTRSPSSDYGTVNTVVATNPEQDYTTVLAPAGVTFAAGDRVQLVQLQEQPTYFWAFPVASAAAAATSPIKARVAATGNVTVSNPGTSSFDGVTLASGDVLFLPFQTAGAENGPYTFNGSTSALTRHADADTSAELVNCEVVVSEGTKNADTKWLCTTDAPITVDTTALTWVRTFPGQVFALVTVTDTGAGHTVKERTWSGTSTSTADGSPTVTYSPCYSTTGAALPVNTVVTVDRHPITPGAYRITPAGDAASGLPGVLNATTQTVTGLKSFETGVRVAPATYTAGMFPAASWPLPTSYAPGTLTYGPAGGPVGDYLILGESSRTAYAVIAHGGSAVAHELWVYTDAQVGAGENFGAFVLVGKYAVYDPSSGDVVGGVTCTLGPGATFLNGCLTYGGAALSAVTSLTDSTGGTVGTTLSAVSGTGDDAGINNGLASLAATVNTLIGRLQSAGIIS